MKGLFQFIFWFVVSLIALGLAIVLGNRGAWYFAWVLGTLMIVLIAVAGTVVLDARDGHEEHAVSASSDSSETS